MATSAEVPSVVPRAALALLGALAVVVQAREMGWVAGRLAAGAPAPVSSEGLLLVTLGAGTPLLCLALGLLVAARRPRDPCAWILLGLLLGFGQTTVGFVSEQAALFAGDPAWFRLPARAYQALITALWPLWMLLFGLYFPEPFAQRGLRRGLLLALALPTLAIGVAVAVARVAAAEGHPLAAVEQSLAGLGAIADVVPMVATGCFFFFMGIRSGTTVAADARRRLWLLHWGTSASLTPTFLIVITSLVRRVPLSATPQWLLAPALLLLFLFPLTLAHVIVVRRALDVRVVVRQGLQYALATRGVRVVQFLVTILVIVSAAELASAPAANRPMRLRYLALGIVAALLLARLARRLRAWIDRRFFREAVDAERVLGELGERVRTLVETGPLVATVSRTLAETLHVGRVAVFLREDGVYRVYRARGAHGVDAEIAFPAGGVVARRLRAAGGRALPVDALAAGPGEPPSEGERAALAALDAQLLLPLAWKDELHGFVSLGPKQSEAPYARADLRLLDSVAVQTGLALETSRLAAAVAAEVVERERYRRELEIAAEVQERLFPQRLPSAAGIDLAGACRPARGVGGDYYDYLDLPGGLIGVAVGDVSGKGIPASLLMATLQASLRALLLEEPADLAAMMARLNRLLYEASAANRYATFFFARFDPATRRLAYVNAGHNPPLLLRGGGGGSRGGGEVVRLSASGPVLGLLAAAAYTEASLTLAPGDWLVGFSDGVSEAMNAGDEEWGEERLVAAVRSASELAAKALIERVLAAADAHVAGAPQFDDMTLIALRLD